LIPQAGITYLVEPLELIQADGIIVQFSFSLQTPLL